MGSPPRHRSLTTTAPSGANLEQDMKHEATFETTVAGIPCGIVVTNYNEVKGDKGTWASDVDYYGYVERDFFIVDRKGYKAPWLEKKVTDKIERRLCAEIDEVMA